MAEDTLYDLLGVSSEASNAEIREAYRKLSKTYHPDRGGTAAFFRQLQQAYEVVSNRASRAEYDESLRRGMGTPRGGKSNREAGTRPPPGAQNGTHEPPPPHHNRPPTPGPRQKEKFVWNKRRLWVAGLVVIIIVLVALDSSKSRTPTAAPPTTTATTTTTTTPPAKGLSITLAQVESFYNARGAETQWWIHGANINGPGCSPTCGERNEDGGAGTGCQLQILGPAGDVDSVLIGCEPGEALSATNKTILTSQAALAILVATVNQFAPFASSWARQELTMGLGDAKEVDAMHSNATTSVDVSASQKVASLEIQVRTT